MGVGSDTIAKDAEQFPWSFTRLCSQWWAVPSYWVEGADREWDEAIDWCSNNLEDSDWMTCNVTRSILTSERASLIFKLRWC